VFLKPGGVLAFDLCQPQPEQPLQLELEHPLPPEEELPGATSA
jgi:hypothetical protein